MAAPSPFSAYLSYLEPPMVPPREVRGSTSSDAAALARARAARLAREAAERKARAEEARKKAEEARAARAHALELRKQARAALVKAAQLRQKADAAAAAVSSKSEQFERMGLKSPALGEKLRKDLKMLAAQSEQAGKTAALATKEANALRREAIAAAKETVTLQKEANALVTQVNADRAKRGLPARPLPFKTATEGSTTKDAYALAKADLADATRDADPLAQAKLDAEKVAQATARSTEDGAEALRELMETADGDNGNAYRVALAQAVAPQVEAMSAEINKKDDRTKEGPLKNILADLSRAAELSGSEGAMALGSAFATQMRDDHLDVDNEDQFGGALRRVVLADGNSPLFAAALHEQLKIQNRNPQAQKEIKNALDPNWKKDEGGFMGFVKGAADAVGLDDAVDLIKKGADAVGLDDAVELLKKGASAAKDFVEDTFGVVAYHDDVEKLGKGDKITLAVGGSASIVGEVHGKGKVEVTRGADGKYTVMVDAEAGVGVVAQAGVEVGPGGVYAGAKATAGVGGKMEFTFDNAADANKAVDTVMDTAMKASGPAGAVGSFAVEHLADMHPQSPAWMSEHLSAMEVRVEGGGKVSAFAGFKGPPAFAGAFANAEAEVRGALRVEFDHGKPENLVFRTEGQVKGKVGAGLGLGMAPPPGTNQSRGAIPGAGGQVSADLLVRMEERVPLKGDVGMGDLLSMAANPRSISQKVDFANTSARLYARGDFDAGGYIFGAAKGVGIRGEIQVDGKPADILASGALNDAAQLHFAEAAGKLNDDLQVAGSFRTYDKHGIDEEIGFRAFGVGAEIDLTAMNQDVSDNALWSSSGRPSEVGASLSSYLTAQMRKLQGENPTTSLRYGRSLQG